MLDRPRSVRVGADQYSLDRIEFERCVGCRADGPCEAPETVGDHRGEEVVEAVEVGVERCRVDPDLVGDAARRHRRRSSLGEVVACGLDDVLHQLPTKAFAQRLPGRVSVLIDPAYVKRHLLFEHCLIWMNVKQCSPHER